MSGSRVPKHLFRGATVLTTPEPPRIRKLLDNLENMENTEKKKLTKEQETILQAELPKWATKAHPTKKNMTVIHPMAVVDILNKVFGIGGWELDTRYISCEPFVQKTKNGERDMFRATVSATFSVEDYGIYLSQFGGSSNDDAGDALKGAATDALTKIASYLGIGAYIYKGLTSPNGEHETTPHLERNDAPFDL